MSARDAGVLTFDAVQVASGEDETTTIQRLSRIEAQIANTRGEDFECFAIKLGLHRFLNHNGDAASLQSESAYCDLVRLSGRDPAAEIYARFINGNPMATLPQSGNC
jgi:hypothetical protein